MDKTPDFTDELWNAYLATKYRASTPIGEITIQIDKPHPELDLLLENHCVEQWAFITAWNPFSEELSLEENTVRHEQLVGKVRELGYIAFEGAGIPENTNWQPETSLLILGVGENMAIDVGIEFGQNAIVLGKKGTNAQLITCR